MLASQAMHLNARAIWLELPPEPDENGEPTPLRDRHAGVPADEIGPDDAYRYLVAPLLRDKRAACRAAERRAQHAGSLTRLFATVGLHKAVAADATQLKGLSEELLLNKDPEAMQYLRAFRDRGIDIIWVRRSSAKSYVAVMFTDAIGGSIEVIEELIATLNRDEQRWEGAAVQRIPSTKWGRRVTPMLPAALVALLWYLAMPVLGVDVTVPLWLPLALVFIPIILLIYGALVRRAGMQISHVLHQISSVPRQQDETVRDAQARRRGQMEMLEVQPRMAHLPAGLHRRGPARLHRFRRGDAQPADVAANIPIRVIPASSRLTSRDTPSTYANMRSHN